MLLYVLAVVLLFAAAFNWASYDDALYQDSGEAAAASRMIGRHAAEIAMCTYPGGEFAPQTIGNNSYAGGVKYATVTNYAYASNVTYPVDGCDSSIEAILAPAVPQIGAGGPAFQTIPKGEWQGLASLVQENYVITVAFTGGDAGSKASQDGGLSLTKLGARLVERLVRSPDGSLSAIGFYDKATGKVRLGNGQGAFFAAPTDVAQLGLVLRSDLFASEVPGGIPNGAPMLISPLPAAGGTLTAAGEVISNAVGDAPASVGATGPNPALNIE